MAKLLKLRRGTTTQHSSFTGAEGEVTIDTTKDTAVVHDGSQAGGRPLLREDMANLPAGTIDNADINTSAAISGTKISPDFGSQDIITTGKLKFANVYTNESDLPSASTYHGMFAHVHSTGLAYYAHAGAWHKLAKLDAPDFTGGIDVTGNITSTGTVSAVDATLSGELNLMGTENTKYMDFNIGSNLLVLRGTSGGDTGHVNMASFDRTGSAVLNYNGTNHLATNSSGVAVTGNLSVTGTVDGRDVAADGTKLDGIESSATADQTAAEIRTLVESASDSNVFTDADHTKLNGIESGATADQTAAEIRTLVDTASDCNVFTNADHGKLDGIESGATADQTGAEIATALNGQNVYTTGNIGRDSNDYIQWADNAQLEVYINGSNEFRFEADGDFHADGDVYAFSTTTASDENLKENIVTITDAVAKVEGLKGVTFKWKENDAVSAGVIAQDVEKVLPEVVKTVANMDGDEYKAVNYGGLTSILIEAIKDLSARVKELEAK